MSNFTKAIVMGPTDFRVFVIDVADLWYDEVKYGDDISFWDYLAGEVDSLFDYEKVDMIMVKLEGRDWEVVTSGDNFILLVKYEYGADYEDELRKEYGLNNDEDEYQESYTRLGNRRIHGRNVLSRKSNKLMYVK